MLQRRGHRVIRTCDYDLSTTRCAFFAQVIQMVAYPRDFSIEISKKGFTKLNSVYYPLRNS
jgi:hypothetical protein